MVRRRQSRRLGPSNHACCAVMVLETMIVAERETPAPVAVMTTGEAEPAPSVTVTDEFRYAVAGTGTAVGFELVRLTMAPPAGPLVFAPIPIWIDAPVLPYGTMLIELSAGAEVSVRRADALPFGRDAVIVDVVVVATAAACTGNITRSAPAGTRIVAGTLTAGVPELERETGRPPAGAGSLRATVPTRSAVPKMLSTAPGVLCAASDTDMTVGPGVSVTCIWFVMPAFVAEIVTHVDEATGT